MGNDWRVRVAWADIYIHIYTFAESLLEIIYSIPIIYEIYRDFVYIRIYHGFYIGILSSTRSFSRAHEGRVGILYFKLALFFT